MGWGGVEGGKDGVGVPLFVSFSIVGKGGPRGAATSKMELFVITVNGYRPLIIIIKGSWMLHESWIRLWLGALKI